MSDRELDEAESVVNGLAKPDGNAYGYSFEFTEYDEMASWTEEDRALLKKMAVKLADDINNDIWMAFKSAK